MLDKLVTFLTLKESTSLIEERADSVERKGKISTVEGVLDQIQSQSPWRGLVVLILLLATHLSTAYAISFPNFGGYIPYRKWECIGTSTLCTDRLSMYKVTNPDKSPYNSDVLCGIFEDSQSLEVGTDFNWDTSDGRSTYAVDWNIYCGTEYKGTLLSSLFFVGGFIGLLVGSFTFDTFGRRTTVIAGYFTVSLCMMISAAAPNTGTLMAIRVIMGIGSYMGLSGLYVYILENVSSKWRGLVSSIVAIGYNLGWTAVLPAFGYFIKGWKWLSVAGGILMLASVFVWFFVPDSPRHLMENKNDKVAAMNSLKRIATLFGRKLDLDEIELKSSKKDTAAPSSYLETLKDFIHFPELRIQLLIQMFQWTILAFLYYGFNFSWGKLGKNIYWSYAFSGIAEVSAALICWFGQDVFGRRMTMLSFNIVGGASFLLALIPLSFGSQNVLTLEQLMCLIGSMFVSGAWGTSYLYVAEQSPTNHRGKMSAVCSIVARLGSFAGPQASLLFTWNKSATLVFFGILSISAGMVSLRLPETKGKKSPNSAQEVEDRRQAILSKT